MVRRTDHELDALELLDLTTACRLLKVKRRTMQRWVLEGKLRGVNVYAAVGGAKNAPHGVRVLRTDIQRILEAAKESSDAI